VPPAKGKGKASGKLNAMPKVIAKPKPKAKAKGEPKAKAKGKGKGKAKGKDEVTANAPDVDDDARADDAQDHNAVADAGGDDDTKPKDAEPKSDAVADAGGDVDAKPKDAESESNDEADAGGDVDAKPPAADAEAEADADARGDDDAKPKADANASPTALAANAEQWAELGNSLDLSLAADKTSDADAETECSPTAPVSPHTAPFPEFLEAAPKAAATTAEFSAEAPKVPTWIQEAQMMIDRAKASNGQ
jgi:hypothetical protein